MSRPLRIEFRCAAYQVTSRGDRRDLTCRREGGNGVKMEWGHKGNEARAGVTHCPPPSIGTTAPPRQPSRLFPVQPVFCAPSGSGLESEPPWADGRLRGGVHQAAQRAAAQALSKMQMPRWQEQFAESTSAKSTARGRRQRAPPVLCHHHRHAAPPTPGLS